MAPVADTIIDNAEGPSKITKSRRLVPRALNCTLLRGGTSRAPIISLSDVLALYPHYSTPSGYRSSPLSDPNLHSILTHILPQIMGTGNPLQIDGVGGGNTLTSKAAVACPSPVDGVDIDYLFAQVSILGTSGEKYVDFSPNCGNVMSAVGVFSVERGMVPSPYDDGEQTIIVRNVNTNTLSDLAIERPISLISPHHFSWGAGPNEYRVGLSFSNVHGAKTGVLLPTRAPSELICGKHASLVDAAVPVVFLLAHEWTLDAASGWTPTNRSTWESQKDAVEEIRREAGWRMGLGDVSQSVLPKVCFVSPTGMKHGSRTGSEPHISVLYLTPHAPHASVAVTGALCILVASCTPGTLPHKCAVNPRQVGNREMFGVGHSGGVLELELVRREADDVVSGGKLVRTARVILDGKVNVWVEE